MKGFTLIELLIATAVLSVIALIGMPVVKDVVESHRITATVETMKAIAATADVARRLPGGNSYSDVTTNQIATLLNTYDVNSLGLSDNPMKTHWGTDYQISTTGQYATVKAIVPIENINPFETVATNNGSSTLLLVSHQPQGKNRSLINTSKYNKHNLYLEPTE